MKALFVLLLFVCTLLCSCAEYITEEKPYSLREASVACGKTEGVCSFACMKFTFANNTKKQVERFSISFHLYDSAGKSAVLNGRGIASSFSKKIAPGASASFVLSLDAALGSVVEEKYDIGQFFVTEIIYSDGSVWKDALGLFMD